MIKKPTIFHSKEERKQIIDTLKQEHDSCWYCGKKGYYVLDHIIPRAKGGMNSIENYALSCWRCNIAKQDTDVGEFIEWLDYIRSDKFKCYIKRQV